MSVYAGKMFMFYKAVHYDNNFVAKLARMSTFLTLMHGSKRPFQLMHLSTIWSTFMT